MADPLPLEEITFHVSGSAKEPYKVRFIRRTEKNISAYCECKAAQNGQVCKHRLNILHGLTTGIISKNAQLAETIPNWLPGSDLEQAFENVLLAEREAEFAKARLRGAKKTFNQRLLD